MYNKVQTQGCGVYTMNESWASAVHRYFPLLTCGKYMDIFYITNIYLRLFCIRNVILQNG